MSLPVVSWATLLGARPRRLGRDHDASPDVTDDFGTSSGTNSQVEANVECIWLSRLESPIARQHPQLTVRARALIPASQPLARPWEAFALAPSFLAPAGGVFGDGLTIARLSRADVLRPSATLMARKREAT